MKNYFDFNLTGKKFFPYWIVYYLLAIVPNAIVSSQGQGQSPSVLSIVVSIFVFFVYIFMYFYFIKLTINGVSLKEKLFNFNGDVFVFAGKMLLGTILSMITLFIYMPWFIKDITKYLVNNTSYKGNNFDFKATGGSLFLVFLLGFLVPMIIIVIIMSQVMDPMNFNPVLPMIMGLAMLLVMVPFMYLTYKWMVNIDYKEYHITLKTDAVESIMMIFGQMLLAIITIGIYAPMAYLKIFKYFIDRTVAVKEGDERNFGFDIQPMNDFLFIWGQLLLCIITLFIYFPWAYVKINKRFSQRTFVTGEVSE